ncbi:4Fe-4S dicluster domain-containing protein [Endozoicomonas sp. SM1973]|uniref:4Fe-4S dicluster domain-containing protein n=1 Tax=Spartinivicinus marinus TaxID=2994442 RepID=A0A853HZ01_9GAMM|nr:4Fe-4S dicluster domain-containing protein [Spartinivicinus marinus]MCX4029659.1 4Fe-4S dicluster domain-containing protein [Spartinivicinus marinus]NYZ66960.1 4Fe-4S dicluster domain-containing protein [Spartinivicinus marinus]
MDKGFLPRQQFPELYQALRKAGYEVIGPTVKDGAIVFSPLAGFEQLPLGWQEQVSPGRYQLEQTAGQRCFYWNTGPQALKPWLFKPEQHLWQAEQTTEGLCFRQTPEQAQPRAFIGLRGCDLAALKIHDQHFLNGLFPDPYYQTQRQQLFIIAVNCARSASTCFCVSTGDGPAATFGFDILLDELETGFLVASGSDQGEVIVQQLPLAKAKTKQLSEAKQQLQAATYQQRTMPDEQQLLKLVNRLDHPQWQDVAERCLACGNCTLVCPTCFCSKQESHSDVKGQQAEQVRLWDSCFSEQHSYIVGKVFRPEISQRYRQWLTHKLATWQQQFERSGCVGCGRCISWCPVGIDLVEEAQALLKDEVDDD